MKYIVTLLAITVAFVSAVSAAGITNTTFVQGVTNNYVTDYQGVKNTTLASNVGNNNYGGSTVLYIGRSNQRSALLHFDLSSLQGQTASILNATLTLTLIGSPTAGDFNVTMYEVFSSNAGWEQGTGTGGAVGPDGTATYSEMAENTTPWKNSSGTAVNAVNLAYDNTAALQTLLYTSASTSLTFNIPTNVIGSWISSPSTHAGLIFAPSTSGGITANTYIANLGMSSDSVFDNRPALNIEFEAIPEPSVYHLVALGAVVLVLLRLRKKA